MFCPKCGSENPDNAQFCQKCGMSLKNSRIVKKPSAPNSDKDVTKLWNKQTLKGKFILLFIVIAILLIGVLAVMATVNDNLTRLSLYNVDSEGSGEASATIIDNSSEYILNGSSEPNATVIINSKDLNITNQTINLDSNNKFTYKIKIPKNFTDSQIKIKASKTGKDDSYIELTLKKSEDNQSEDTPQNNQATGKYSVGNSKFDITDEWTLKEISGDNNPNLIYFSYLKSLSLNVEQFSDQESFDSSYNEYITDSSGNYEITTQEKTIEGINVKIILTDDKRNTDNFKDYYFTKNGKYYAISVSDYSNYKSISNEKIDDAVNMIIKTIQ